MEGAHIAKDQSSNATLLRPRKAFCSVWRPDPGPAGGTHPSVASSIFKPHLRFLKLVVSVYDKNKGCPK